MVSGAEIRTFLFADIRGYTRFTQEHGDDAASALAGQFADLVRETVPEFDGELVELRGDEALCVFSSARQALLAAIRLQRRFRAPTGGQEPFPLGVGMGLDAGEAVPTEGGYRGRALNFAARLCAVAHGGEVLASEGLAHLAHPLQGVRLAGPRAIRLKGVAEPVRVVRVESDVPLPPVPPPPGTPRSRTRIVLIGTACIIALAGAAAFLLGRTDGGGSKAAPIARSSIAVIDARTGAVLADYRIPVGSAPAPLVFGNGALWTYNEARQTLIRIDPATGRYQERGIPVVPTDLAVGGGYEWLADGLDNKLYQLDWSSGLAATPVPLPGLRVKINYSGFQRPSISGQVTAYGKTVWATSKGVNWPETISSYDAVSLTRTHTYRLNLYSREIGDVASGPAGVWMENRIGGEASGRAALVPLTPTLGQPRYVSQGGYLQQGVAVDTSSVWFAPGQGTGATGRTVADLDPKTGSWVPVIAPAPITAIAAGPAGVWAAATTPGAVYQLAANGTIRSATLRSYVTGLAVGRTRVWALIQTTPIEQGAVQ